MIKITLETNCDWLSKFIYYNNDYQYDAIHELGHEGVLAGGGADRAGRAHAGPCQAAGQAAHAQDASHLVDFLLWKITITLINHDWTILEFWLIRTFISETKSYQIYINRVFHYPVKRKPNVDGSYNFNTIKKFSCTKDLNKNYKILVCWRLNNFKGDITILYNFFYYYFWKNVCSHFWESRQHPALNNYSVVATLHKLHQLLVHFYS